MDFLKKIFNPSFQALLKRRLVYAQIQAYKASDDVARAHTEAAYRRIQLTELAHTYSSQRLLDIHRLWLEATEAEEYAKVMREYHKSRERHLAVLLAHHDRLGNHLAETEVPKMHK